MPDSESTGTGPINTYIQPLLFKQAVELGCSLSTWPILVVQAVLLCVQGLSSNGYTEGSCGINSH